ncbi:MAG: prepilin-type N-terminal cleavage/methylation domain-containing protein [Desulfuromonadales bacterium]
MLKGRQGFSLVELMVVVAIMGMVIAAVLGLYSNVQKSTGSSEDVAEVQQSLRVALDRITDDILMSGFLVGAASPIVDAQADSLTLRTASAFNSWARVSADISFPDNTTKTIAVDSPEMAQLFGDDNYVRIVRPVDGCQPAEPVATSCGGGASPFFKVTSVNPNPADPADPPTVTMKPQILSGGAIQGYNPSTPISVQVGDMLVQIPSPGVDPTFPNLVTYRLFAFNGDNYLLRDTNVEEDLTVDTATKVNTLSITNKITGLNFAYVMDDGTVEPTPVAAARLDSIVAVRVTITGQTDGTATEGVKTREIQSTIKLRNN